MIKSASILGGMATIFLIFTLNMEFTTGLQHGFINLTPIQTEVFFWGLISILYLLSGFALYALTLGNKKERQIILDEEHFITPATGLKAFKQDNFNIPYSSVKNIKLQSVYEQHFAHITFDGGKVTIPASMLQSIEIFEEIIDTISKKSFSHTVS